MSLRKNQAKTERLEARLTRDQKNTIQRAADLTGCSLSDFTISNLVSQASKIIQEHQIIKLSMDDQIAFAQAILKPTKPNARLVKAAKSYKNKLSKIRNK